MNTTRTILFDTDFKDKVDNYRAMIFEADVVNQETTQAQKTAMEELAADIAEI